jgi:hypothetical protein
MKSKWMKASKINSKVSTPVMNNINSNIEYNGDLDNLEGYALGDF